MIRVFTAFSGYDSQCIALDRAGIEYDLVGWSEIDKYAIMAHDAIYPQYKDRNYGDITKIDWNDVPEFDLFTYSSPCQDFSKAGNLRGGQEGSGTRSSLLWTCKEAIRIKRPRFCLLENVENLVSKRFYPLFHQWEQLLAEMGYKNTWSVVNAMECGIPQNRKRVFLVSILDPDSNFRFPAKQGRVRPLEDFLEDDEAVDEKYYIPRERITLIQDEETETENAETEGSERAEAHRSVGHPSVPAQGKLFL